MLSDSQRIGLARQLLQNGLFQELVEKREKAALAKWRGAAPENDQIRLEAWYEDRAMASIVREVEGLAQSELIEDES